jgi:hypothetical protein
MAERQANVWALAATLGDDAPTREELKRKLWSERERRIDQAALLGKLEDDQQE